MTKQLSAILSAVSKHIHQPYSTSMVIMTIIPSLLKGLNNGNTQENRATLRSFYLYLGSGAILVITLINVNPFCCTVCDGDLHMYTVYVCTAMCRLPKDLKATKITAKSPLAYLAAGSNI